MSVEIEKKRIERTLNRMKFEYLNDLYWDSESHVKHLKTFITKSTFEIKDQTELILRIKEDIERLNTDPLQDQLVDHFENDPTVLKLFKWINTNQLRDAEYNLQFQENYRNRTEEDLEDAKFKLERAKNTLTALREMNFHPKPLPD